MTKPYLLYSRHIPFVCVLPFQYTQYINIYTLLTHTDTNMFFSFGKKELSAGFAEAEETQG